MHGSVDGVHHSTAALAGDWAERGVSIGLTLEESRDGRAANRGVRAFTPRGAFYLWAEFDPANYERLGVSDAGDAFGVECADAITSRATRTSAFHNPRSVRRTAPAGRRRSRGIRCR